MTQLAIIRQAEYDQSALIAEYDEGLLGAVELTFKIQDLWAQAREDLKRATDT